MLKNSKTQIVIKLENLNCDKTQIVEKKNSKCDEEKNSKTQNGTTLIL